MQWIWLDGVFGQGKNTKKGKKKQLTFVNLSIGEAA